MTTVHTISECRAERRHALLTGAWVGAALALVFAAAAGAILADYTERSHERTYAALAAQYDIALEAERRRVARYAEIDTLARAYDAMQGRD